MSKKILVTEDEKPLSHAMQLKLTNAGYDVTVVNDGQQAIDLLDKEKFDLVLLDLIMPNVDGFHVLDHIGKNNIDAQVIVMSNLSQEEDRDKAKALGAKDFFIKSDISLEELIQQVDLICK